LWSFLLIGGADPFLSRTQVTIGEITEEVTTFAKDKNPSIKAETIKWYTRCLQLTSSPPPRADLDALIEVLKKALGDSGEPVRVAAADGLGTLMKVVGERAMGGKTDDLDDLRKAKVKEAFEKAEVKCKNGGAAARPAPAAAAPAASKPKPVRLVSSCVWRRGRLILAYVHREHPSRTRRMRLSPNLLLHQPPPRPAAGSKAPPARVAVSLFASFSLRPYAPTDSRMLSF
jgi:cytoskeleton-associated protein 5